jgi:hypothetical protein
MVLMLPVPSDKRRRCREESWARLDFSCYVLLKSGVDEESFRVSALRRGEDVGVVTGLVNFGSERPFRFGSERLVHFRSERLLRFCSEECILLYRSEK